MVSVNEASDDRLSRPSRDIPLWGNSRLFFGRPREWAFNTNAGKASFFEEGDLIEWHGMSNLLNLSTLLGVGDQ